MKQNDLIISIVAIVLALIIAGVCWGTKREPATIAPPEVVNLGKLEAPQAEPVMANSLSGGSGGNTGGGGRGGFGAPAGLGGPGGPVGPASGFGGPGGRGAPTMASSAPGK